MIQKLVRTISKLTMGTSATASIIAEEGRVTLGKCFKYRLRAKRLNKEIEQNKIYWEQLHNFKSENVHPVTSPLVLISQIQRSGGSLLSQLFDGHPEVHPHPHELMLGYKKKYVWPRIDLNEHPERWFRILFENMDIFFEVYPDGRLISLIRDPKNWFPSALRHGPKLYGDIKLAIFQWKESAQAMLRNKKRYSDRICLIKFEDLVT